MSNILILSTAILPTKNKQFVEWQGKFNKEIARWPGFISLEILAPNEATGQRWVVVQRFRKASIASHWSSSDIYQNLLKELESIVVPDTLEKRLSGENGLQNCVTEVFVTQVDPKKESIFRQWIAKIHQAEAKFPGFRGVYVQSPSQGRNWITLLQFETQENLDHWLNSSERKELLRESESLITALESHRVVSAYAGWFSSLVTKGEIPSAWKQTMLVLLVLFPIVMLELKFLSPLTKVLDISLATFMGNALSVALIAWPMMPLAISLLGWWLAPKPENKKRVLIGGIILVTLIYLLEIILFWHFI